MKSSEDVADMIASVVHSTRYAHEEWVGLMDAERKQIVARWTTLIRQDPEKAADMIIQDILSRPGLGEAWRKLVETRDSGGRRNCFVHLVMQADHDAK